MEIEKNRSSLKVFFNESETDAVARKTALDINLQRFVNYFRIVNISEICAGLSIFLNFDQFELWIMIIIIEKIFLRFASLLLVYLKFSIQWKCASGFCWFARFKVFLPFLYFSSKKLTIIHIYSLYWRFVTTRNWLLKSTQLTHNVIIGGSSRFFLFQQNRIYADAVQPLASYKKMFLMWIYEQSLVLLLFFVWLLTST